MKIKALLTSIAILVLLATILSVTVKASVSTMQGDGTEVRTINPSTGDGNFVYSSANGTVGTRFNATMWIYDVPEMFSFQVKVYVNDTLLNITRAWIPSMDSDYIFYGLITMPLGPTFYDFDANGVMESMVIGATIMGAGSASGSLLAIVEFEIIYTPPSGTVSCDLNIDNPDTKILDPGLSMIDCTIIDGYYEFIGPEAPKPPHADFTYSPSEPRVGRPVTFDASASTPDGGTIVSYIWNFGDGTPEVTETDPTITHLFTSNGTFNVTLTVVDSEGLNDTTWRTVTVLAAPEIDMDVNDDGKVDIMDIATVALSFGSYPGHERWNEVADINKDGIVDMFDLVLIAANFGLTL